MALFVCPHVFSMDILEEGKISSEDDTSESDGDFNDVVMTWNAKLLIPPSNQSVSSKYERSKMWSKVSRRHLF